MTQADDERPLKCYKCLQFFPAKDFPILIGGNRRRACPNCFQGKKAQKCCIRCKQVKSTKYHFKRTRTNHYHEVCRECAAMMPSQTVYCKRCDRDREVERFGRYRNNARHPYCEDCHVKQDKDRQCTRCGLRKSIDAFHRLKSSAHSKVCDPCLADFHAQRGRKPIEAPNPCSNCGKRFSVIMPKCRRDKLKYCSRECVNAGLTVIDKECNLCLEVKPGDQFPFFKNKRGRTAYCKACAEKKDRGEFRATKTRLSVASIVRNLRFRAKFKNIDVRVSVSDAKKLVDKPCDMCGNDMYCLIAKDEGTDLTTDNVVPSCLECRDLVQGRGYLQMVEWAKLVAEGHGMVRATHSSQVIKPAKPKRRAFGKDYWLHPDTPSLQDPNESFEERLARVSRQTAERKDANDLARYDRNAYSEVLRAQKLEKKAAARAAIAARNEKRS